MVMPNENCLKNDCPNNNGDFIVQFDNIGKACTFKMGPIRQSETPERVSEESVMHPGRVYCFFKAALGELRSEPYKARTGVA